MTRWGTEIGPALDPGFRGTLRVTGGPGTGKSSLLADIAAAHIAGGADPRTVLFLTGSGRLGMAARSALTGALLAACADPAGLSPAVVGEPLVRTVHGYAFAVLRRAAQRAGNPPPRLVTSGEQDAIIRELLAGAGAQAWPDQLRAAVSTDGFATELRNLLARCAERGIDPAQLSRLGRRCGRPEWVAAARFAYQYEQVMLLRAAVGMAAPQATVPALGAAELVGAALDALAADRELLAAERSRVRILLVDDAQQLDPQAARLVRVLAGVVEVTVIGYDPDQAVFGFRGGGPNVLRDVGARSPRAADAAVTLRVSHRCSPSVAQAINGIAGLLPGARGAGLDGCSAQAGSVAVRSTASCHAEAALIVDTLRRAHLLDGVPWSQMAVLVRSAPRAADRLPRALVAAGIPVTVAATDGPLVRHPVVAALLTVLTAASDGLDEQRALALLTGPIGRVDPVSLRQLRRLLRQAGNEDTPAVLAAALTGEPGRLPTGHARPLRRLRSVLQAATASHRAGREPSYTLWQAWHRSGLQQRWLKLRERGGPVGVQADRDLDAVTALFDIAEQYVSQTPGASLRGLVDHVTTMQLAPRAEPAAGVDAVSVLSAHAALGHEWDLVVIAGLQEGLWPNTVPRGGVLCTQRLLDVLDGVCEQASTRAPLLAEERRLLVAAMGRARRHLLVTAVDGDGGAESVDDEIPSGFFTELTRWDTTGAEPDRAAPSAAPPVLSAAAVVGRLRGVVCAPGGAVDDVERNSAATQLARLADAGVPGADPAGWYGLAPVSTDEPLWHAGDGAITLSPSSMQTLIDCPLRWLVERHGGTDGRDLRSTIGSVIHALIAEPDAGESDLPARLARLWPQLPFDSPWYAVNELDRHRTLLASFAQWREHSRAELTEAGTEVDVDGMIDGVRLRGRIDRVERDAAGRVVIVDVKTSKTPVSKDDAQRHAQLALYQLAVDAGLLAHGDEPGGGRLVYPAKPATSGATERMQDALTPDGREHWRPVIAEAAAATAGPAFAARVNDGCRHCPVRPICPAHRQESTR